MRKRAVVIAATVGTLLLGGCEEILTVCQELVVGDTHFVGLMNRVSSQTRYVRMFYRRATATAGRHRALLAWAPERSRSLPPVRPPYPRPRFRNCHRRQACADLG